MAMCRDKAFVEDASAPGVDLSPIDGAEVGKLIAQSAATPKPMIARFNALRTRRRN
jgi:hypothetical protein